MPSAVKNKKNMRKHLTATEAKAREAAEMTTMPDRGDKLKLRKPGFISQNLVANRYWNSILRSMEGLILLDDLDSEMLAGYCAMLARRDQTILMVQQLMAAMGVDAAVGDGRSKRPRKTTPLVEPFALEASAQVYETDAYGRLDPSQILEAVGKLDALTGKLQALEKILLAYAEKLGLTPSGRVRLAQQRAACGAEAAPDADLYGD